MMKRRHLVTGTLAASLVPMWFHEVAAQTPMQLSIPNTLEQVDQLLSSEFARVGLASVVRTVYSFRRQFRPAGYETTSDWNQKFEESFTEFHETLWKLSPQEVKKSVLSDKPAIARFEAAYSKNAPKFAEFRSSAAAAQSAPPYVRASSPEMLARGQLLFAAVLRARSAGSLNKAASITAIWPFCE